MGKSSAAANVIDLEAFRQKKRESERDMEMRPAPMNAQVLVPVWYCWVPVWAPVIA